MGSQFLHREVNMFFFWLTVSACAAPVLDAPDGTAVGKPLRAITALALSPDGRLVAVAEGKGVVVLNVATGKQLCRYEKHTDTIRALAFHPDGRHLASASLDKFVRLQDLKRPGHDARAYSFGAPAWCLAFSHDGKRLAVGGETWKWRLYDVDSGKEMAATDVGCYFPGSLAFSPDGKSLALFPGRIIPAGGKAAPPGLRVYDLATRAARELNIYWGPMPSGFFTADGKRIVFAHGKGLGLWPVGERASSRLAPAFGGPARFVVPSPDGKLFAAAGPDGVVRLLDQTTLEQAAQPVRLRGELAGVAFLKGGKELLTATAAGNLQRWAVHAPARRVYYLHFPGGAQALAVSPDGKSLAATTCVVGPVRTLRRIDLPTCKQVWASTLPGKGNAMGAVAWSPDGKTIAAGDGEMRLFDAATGKLLSSTPTPYSWLESMGFRSDGRVACAQGCCIGLDGKVAQFHDAAPGVAVMREIIFAGSARRVAGYSAPNVAVVADWGGGKFSRQFKLPSPGKRLALSPDGRKLAVCLGAELCLFDVEAGKELGRLKIGAGAYRIAFSPDSKRLAAFPMRGGNVTVWEAEGKFASSSWRAHPEFVFAASFTHDGKSLFTAGQDDVIRLWDVATGEEKVALGP